MGGGRYVKHAQQVFKYSKKYIERSQRICRYCLANDINVIEDEAHFIVNCPLYTKERKLLYDKVDTFCTNFKQLPNESKYFWLLTNEHLPTLTHLGNFIIDSLENRSSWKQNK